MDFLKTFLKEKLNIKVKDKPRGYDPKLALSVLITAKAYYEHRPAFLWSGMCVYMLRAYRDLTKNDPSYNTLTKLIPEFNYKFLGGRNSFYWWDIEDSKSRLKAFDKLIELYS